MRSPKSRDEGRGMRDEELRQKAEGGRRKAKSRDEGGGVSREFEGRACARPSRRTPDAMQRGGPGSLTRDEELKQKAERVESRLTPFRRFHAARRTPTGIRAFAHSPTR
jgi:hypothetical protein